MVYCLFFIIDDILMELNQKVWIENEKNIIYLSINLSECEMN